METNATTQHVLCQNCLHKDKIMSYCLHPEFETLVKNTNYFVDGQKTRLKTIHCSVARENENMCGKSGSKFEELVYIEAEDVEVFSLKKSFNKKFIYLWIGFVFLGVILSFNLSAATPSSFSKARTILYTQVFNNSGETFYCGCDWSNRKVDIASCGYQIRKNKKRALRTEVEHVMPAYWIAHRTPEGRACWTKGTELKGTTGRKYCLKTNPEFKAAYTDLMNLRPAIGEINGDRSNYKFGIIPGEKRVYGQCDFEISKVSGHKHKIAEPPEHVRGDIARIYFYMIDKYKLVPTLSEVKQWQQWMKDDPLTDDEFELIKRIVRIQN